MSARTRPHTWASLAALTSVLACGGPERRPSDGPLAAASAPASSPKSAASGSAPAAPTGPATSRTVQVTRAALADLDEPAGAAPCDLERAYRGTIGSETRVSMVLRRGPGGEGTLAGATHYDLPGPGLPATGTRSGRQFTLTERGGATFRGVCDDGGVLRGEVTMGKRTLPFTLSPRPAGEPGLFRMTRKAEGELRPPGCAAVASRTEVTFMTDDEGREIPCAPTDPAHRKAALRESPELRCAVVDASLQVFGLADPKVERSVNEALAGPGFAHDEKRARACTGPFVVQRTQRLVWAGSDVLVVSPFEARSTGGPRPMSHRGSSRALELRTGRALAVTDVATLSALSSAASRCLAAMSLADDSRERFALPLALPTPPKCGSDAGDRGYLWGCEGAPSEPTWTLLPEGLVIGAWGVPQVAAHEGGRGPVLSWSVLLRDGALLAGSPLARLWAGVAAAGDDALACAGTYHGDHVRAWR